MSRHQWTIQIIASFFIYFLTIEFCFIILLFICVILTIGTTWRGGKHIVAFPSGPGFESQVPHFLNVIFLQVIMCALRLEIYHTPSPIKAPDG